jgi:hypothetical protein
VAPLKVAPDTHFLQIRLDQAELAATPAIAALQTDVAGKQSQLVAGAVEGGHPLLLPGLTGGGFFEPGQTPQGDTVRALKVSSPLVATSDSSHVHVSLDQSQLAATSAIAALQTAVAGKQDVLGFVPDEDPNSYQILQNGVIRALKVSSPLVATSDMSQVHVRLDPGWSPYFCAGRVNANATIATSIGRVGYTVHRHWTQPAGVIEIRFTTPAPNNNYVVTLTQQGSGNIKLWDSPSQSGPPTAERFYVVLYNTNWQLADFVFHFAVVT